MTVTATVEGLASAVSFTVEASGFVIWLGATRGWGFGLYERHVAVPPGTIIEWRSEVDWCCPVSYSITSTSTPPGGAPFASGVLNSTEPFQFVAPAVAGTWEYTAREFDAEVPNGGGEDFGTITVE